MCSGPQGQQSIDRNDTGLWSRRESEGGRESATSFYRRRKSTKNVWSQNDHLLNLFSFEKIATFTVVVIYELSKRVRGKLFEIHGPFALGLITMTEGGRL